MDYQVMPLSRYGLRPSWIWPKKRVKEVENFESYVFRFISTLIMQFRSLNQFGQTNLAQLHLSLYLNSMTTGRNPTTTGLKSKHFSQPLCHSCKTSCPVRATITSTKRRIGTFVHRRERTGSDFCLNSKIQSRWKIAWRPLTVVHAQGRMFPVVVRLLSRWYTDRPTVYNRL